MNTKKIKASNLSYIALIIICCVSLAALFILQKIWPNWLWENEPVHSTVETLGAVAALILSYLLFQTREKNPDWNSTGLVLGFLGMGVLDGFHALTSPGQGFVFLHSLAALLGGFGFILVLIPKQKMRLTHSKGVVLSFLIFCITIGIWGFFYQEILPSMVLKGTFSPLARGINIIAGVFFLIAGFRFIILYRKTNDNRFIMYALMAALFGFGGLTFEYSKLWDATWWFWHILRLAAFCVILFIAERTYKDTNERLWQLNQRLVLTADAARFGVWDLDLVNNELVWDDWMFRLYNIKREDFGGAYDAWKKGLHPDDLKRASKEIDMAIQGEKNFNTEFRIVWPSGEVRHIRAYAAVMKDKNGNPDRMTGINIDITEKRRAEERVQRQMDQIKNINRKLENYSYTVSHDLKEPIRSIRTFSQFILDDYTDSFNDEARDYFNRIINASTRMAAMIGDLLTLSQIGREDVELKKINISDIINEAKKILRNKINETSTDIIISEMPEITCQPLWITSVFQNLITNSIKYGDKDKNIIEISYNEFENYYEFSFKDNGKGIEKNQQHKVFGLFRKAHQDRNIEGSGAGLTIVESIVAEHRGSVWIDWSEPEKGTIIKFTINKKF